MIQAPKDGTVFAEEPKAGRYILPFAPELVQFIKDKQKAVTYRFGDKYDYLQIGDEVQIQDVDAKEMIGRAKLTNKSWTTFKDLPLDGVGHEAYRDKEHQRHILEGYYAYTGKPVEDDSAFLVLEFRLI